MKTFIELVRELKDQSKFHQIALNPLAQFGSESRPRLGATLLPEQFKRKNQYTESQIRYRSILANDGTSYSPAQLNPGGRIQGSFDVKFGNTNQADVMDAQTYELVLELLMESGRDNSSADMQAAAEILNWYQSSITDPVLDKNEKQRWDAIVTAQVIRNVSGSLETVSYANPAGHRVNIPGGTVANPVGWYETDGTYDPFTDLFAGRRKLAEKGYTVSRIISSFEPWYVFARNSAIFTRFSGISINASGNLSRVENTASQDRINNELRSNSLPAWETYDRVFNYRDPADPANVLSGRYLGEQTDANGTYFPVVMVATTGRNDTIELTAEQEPIRLADTLGYHGIGRVLGQPSLGRIVNIKTAEMHPGGLTAECIQEGLPVITEPEAIYIAKVYKPA